MVDVGYQKNVGNVGFVGGFKPDTLPSPTAANGTIFFENTSGVIRPHRNRICSEPNPARDIKKKRRLLSAVLTGPLPIDPDCGVIADAIGSQRDPFPREIGRNQ